MAERRPLVLVAGVITELAPPDELPEDVIPTEGGKTFAFFMA